MRSLSLLLCAGAGAASDVHSPSFFWSTKSVEGLPPATEHLREVYASNLDRTVAALEGKPEVRLVFEAEGLDTEAVRKNGARLPTLEKLLKTSAASLAMPFTLIDAQPLFEEHTHVAADAAEAYFQEHAPMLTDGKTDVVVVQLRGATDASLNDRLAAYDATLARITQAVHTGTKGNYAALLTASHPPHTHHRKLATKPISPYLHTGPTLLTAQLVCLILFCIFMSGFCCLFSLQTPAKFEEVKEKAQ